MALTRRLDTAGPYGDVPDAAPPFHARQNDPADDARPEMSRLTGTDTDPLAGAAPAGVRSWDGSDLGYTGRDVTDSSTWDGRPYNEAPGMFSRLTEEAQTG